MGLIVGMVIVYQILFSDIASHLKEYATLKAMGYSNFYLGRTVLSAALLLALFGFVPGLALSAALYDVVGKATFLPLAMDANERAAFLEVPDAGNSQMRMEFSFFGFYPNEVKTGVNLSFDRCHFIASLLWAKP